MSFQYITNPLTNRKVNVKSRLGKQILNNYNGGGINPNTGNEWSSYSCDFDSEPVCKSQPNERCMWVSRTSKSGKTSKFCRKSQCSSRKRGQKHWEIVRKNMLDNKQKSLKQQLEELDEDQLFDLKDEFADICSNGDLIIHEILDRLLDGENIDDPKYKPYFRYLFPW
jgi:hypothetical protein